MGSERTQIFVFHPFFMDAGQRLLSREGQPVVLTPKEFDTLQALVEARGRVLDKEELITRVWPDSYVGDGSLARNISVLRKALGEGVIETHRGRGYRIAIPITQTDGVSASSTLRPAASQTDVPMPVVGSLGPGSWSRTAGLVFGIGLATLVLVLVASRFLAHRDTKALASASASPTTSILIQKEGATDPLDEGFRLYLPDETPSPHAVHNRETNGWDRWRFVSRDQNYYYRPLTAEEKDFALQRDWKLICTCALESGAGFADIDFAGKGRRFDIEFMQEGNRYFVGLTRQISPTFEVDEKVEFPGVADVDHPHTYELRYDHVSRTASLWIDGKQKASGYPGYQQFQEDRGLFFGAEVYGAAPEGRAVFRRVRFQAQ